ncbi:hypothetical protein RRG08_062309 [Elysia crispata]|uniref:Uncharacterized protein n=1 Tax=Elysia crispata TaxID=231223 RepID=A0AAE0YGL9_9GAST|nr:hypothetical protein RRG08_062309 [Elysia crispata]
MLSLLRPTVLFKSTVEDFSLVRPDLVCEFHPISAVTCRHESQHHTRYGRRKPARAERSFGQESQHHTRYSRRKPARTEGSFGLESRHHTRYGRRKLARTEGSFGQESQHHTRYSRRKPARTEGSFGLESRHHTRYGRRKPARTEGSFGQESQHHTRYSRLKPARTEGSFGQESQHHTRYGRLKPARTEGSFGLESRHHTRYGRRKPARTEGSFGQVGQKTRESIHPIYGPCKIARKLETPTRVWKEDLNTASGERMLGDNQLKYLSRCGASITEGMTVFIAVASRDPCIISLHGRVDVELTAFRDRFCKYWSLDSSRLD